MRSLHAGALLLLLSPLAACGDQLVGWPVANERPERPTVSGTVPADLAIDVGPDAVVTATFDQFMAPATITHSFTVRERGTDVAGAVSYFGATGMFDPEFRLDFDTTYIATISDVATNMDGLSLAHDYEWSFTTVARPPLGAPMVVSTIPDSDATLVELDASVFAMFSEPMDALTITESSFLLSDDDDLPIDGSVAHMGTFAVFTPDAPLAPDTLYTGTITTEATDVGSVPLQEDYLWSFSTSDDPQAPYVVYTEPGDLETGVALETQVTAVFSEAMAEDTITDETFLLMDDTTPIDGAVSYQGVTATFTPTQWLDPDTEYTAIITEDAQDMLGSGLSEDYVWWFTTADVIQGLQPVNLRSLSTFVAVAGAGLTNSNSSGTTTLNGDVGLSPSASCIGDGSPCTQVNPVINGTLYAADPGGIAAQAKADLALALVDAMGRPPGTVQADLAGLTLAPGVYTSTSTMSIAVGGTLVLDGQGNPNAVWIFQIGSSLTVGNDVQVLLINGAKAKNVFWAAGASSTLGSDVSFQGTILAQASNAVDTDSTVVGRLLCTDGEITLLSDTITLPPL